VKIADDGTMILDADDLRLVAERSEWVVELMRDLPGDRYMSEADIEALCAEAVRRHRLEGPLRGR
jgi:hypothetical protein